MEKFLNFVNGVWVKPARGGFYDVINPFDQGVIAQAPLSDAQDVAAAVDAARRAFEKGPWGQSLPSDRAKVLWRMADLVEQNADYLAELESRNQGKTLKYARDSDLPFIVDTLRFFAGVARVLEGKAAAEYSGMGTSMIRREPVGVVAGIVPWNYPLYIAVWKVAPALAAGNVVVVKPAGLTPLTVLEFAKLAERAGVPKGVLNVVTGSGEVVGAALARHAGVDMVSFTGDTVTGRRVMESAASNVKRVHLELGGKAPMVVLPDADVEMAVEGAVVGGFWNAGQDCTAVTRVYVHKAVVEKFVRLMVDRAKRFVLGDPLDRGTDMGPLVSEKQRERVEKYVSVARGEGARVHWGGKRPVGKGVSRGFFYEPTVLSGVEHASRVCQEEIFGPVVSVFSYQKVEDAVVRANDVVYGLAASVYGSNVAGALRVASQLRFGTVWVNEHGVLTPEMPHGGFRQSGFGKDLGLYSLEEYTKVKHVYVDVTGLRRRSWHYTVYGKK